MRLHRWKTVLFFRKDGKGSFCQAKITLKSFQGITIHRTALCELSNGGFRFFWLMTWSKPTYHHPRVLLNRWHSSIAHTTLDIPEGNQFFGPRAIPEDGPFCLKLPKEKNHSSTGKPEVAEKVLCLRSTYGEYSSDSRKQIEREPVKSLSTALLGMEDYSRKQYMQWLSEKAANLFGFCVYLE